MITLNNSSNKRIYVAPHVESVQLESEISLALESEPLPLPPFGPDEVMNAPENFNNNPLTNNMA